MNDARPSPSLEEKRRALLELQLRRRQEELVARQRVTAAPRDGRMPCSYQQEGLWFLHQLDPSSTYHVPFALRLRGAIDVGALQEALTRLVGRHESLRTRFVDVDGVPWQVIDPPPESWPIEWIGVDEVNAATQRPFDLADGPLFRTSLARIGPEEHVLLLVTHHIVVDGWSWSIISADLADLYSGGSPSPLEIQPADHAVWQRRWLSGDELDRQIGFWRDNLKDVPVLEFPTDRPRPAQPTGAGAVFTCPVPDDLVECVRELGRQEQASFLSVLLAGFLVVLNRYSGQDDIAVGSVFSGRTRSEIEPLVGFFANTLVLRTSLVGDPTLRELVRRCNDNVLAATAHQDVPFGLVVDALRPQRVPGRNPLFQVSFTLQAAAVAGSWESFGGLEVSQFDFGWDRSRFDLAVAAVESADGGLSLQAEYSTELFDEDRIERLAGHLFQALAEPDRPISAIGLLDEREADLVLRAWNPAPVQRPRSLLHQLPATDGVAMRFEGAELSYRELDRRSNALAHRLIAEGVQPGDIVGVLLERGFDLPVTELGVLKAGAAWLPLDPQYPADRLAYQISDAGARIVVSTFDVPADVKVLAPTTDEADSPPEVHVDPEDTAYVIYTSGSTGRPKGVMVPHRAAVHFCRNLVELFSMTPDDRVLQFANPTFDVSVSDFFATFTAGATVISAPRSTLLDPEALQELIRTERVTFGDIPPAVLRLLSPEGLDELRVLFIGMEPFGPELVNRWRRPGREFHNGYGPTEVTITCVDYKCPDETLTAQPPIGRAMANHRAYVLDPTLRPVPIGVPGELYMAGAGLAHGYLGRPDLTAEKFLPDPFFGSGERMYATGDLVRWNADGNIEFIGRVDRQVKIRGLRIELGEIEHMIGAYEGVKQCAVTVHEGTRLVAYVVGSVAGLREHLVDRLPRHMVPSVYMTLDELPLTPTGKLDVARLPSPDLGGVFVEPETETQQRLAQVWAALLKIERVGADDDFFGLGGNSLQATQVIARIRDAFGVTLDPRRLFAAPTLRQVALQIDEASTRPEERIVPVPRTEPLPCTYQQEGLWFLQQLDPASSVYHMPIALRVRGPLDVPALERAVSTLVRRHESLRTRFVDRGGVPWQVVDPAPSSFPMERVAGEDIAATAHRPFDLARGSFRAALAQVGPEEHMVLLVVHHIVADGWSIALMANELAALYEGEPLSDLEVQPADHAAWQRRWLTGEVLEQQVGYWRETLAGLPVLEFPSDRPRPAQPTGAGAVLQQAIPAAVAEKAREMARTERVSFLAVLLAGFLTVVHRYTGQTDVAVGSVFSGRTRSEIEPLLGFFANTLVLRTGLDGEPTFRELVRRCNETVLGATAHQEVPFGLVVDALKPERVAGRNPLFQISFSLQTGGTATASFRLGDNEVEPVSMSWERSRFDMTLAVIDYADGKADFTAEYSTELFDRDRVERLIAHFTRALEEGLARPDTVADDLPVFDATVRFDPPVPRPGGLLQDLVKRAGPDHVAMRFEGAELSYRELDERSDRLAAKLSSLVKPGDVVGVLLERGLDLPVAQIGVVKTGAAWMPLDPQHPAKRIAFQIADAKAPVVITSPELEHLLPSEVPTIWLSSLGEDASPPQVDVRPDDVAYVMYTSGSTGTPKGVMVSHRAAVQYAYSAAELFGITPGDRLSAVANPCFDVSIFDTYAAFAAGATVIAAPRERLLDPAALGALLRDERVTVSYVPGALLSLVDPAAPRDLRALMVAGEPCPVELPKRWERPGLEFHNGYGPTEATVTCVDYVCPPGFDDWTVPIGRAMANQRAYVLDAKLRPVPVGVAGELYIAGAGLARGYLGRPDLTAEKFLPDPFCGSGERMYATGDLVRLRADGNIEFIGRVDRQVKIRGLRIELGEIEHVIRAHEGVRQCVVTVHEGAQLVAYVAGSVEGLREHLLDRLPLYMVPTHIVALAELPLTPNGKLDQARLPAPVAETVAFAEPETPTQQRIAELWQRLLNVDRVGLHDNFFTTGGNSLKATQLIAAIRESLGVSLDPRALFTHPTLGQLASRVDGPARPQATVSPLVPLRTGGTQPPLFFVHAVGGSVAPYVALAAQLGDDRPFYALEDPGLHGGRVSARSVRDIAAAYLAVVREVQPEGPLHLGGWSFGGAVALEMARQDGDVAVTFVLDTGIPPEDAPDPGDAELRAWFDADIAGMGAEPGEAELADRFRVFAANTRAFLAHRPSRVDGRVVLLCGEDSEPEYVNHWRAFADEIHHVRGNHYTMLQPPHSEKLAEALRDELSEVSAR